MKIRPELKEKLEIAVERLFQKVKLVKKEHPEIELGVTEALMPENYVEDDPLRQRGNTEWLHLIDPENSAVDSIIREILAEAPATDPAKMAKLDENNLWVWGGPTPYWGGSMADDTLVRGADYYNAGNVVYVYGPTNDKMLTLHSKYKRMLCQINANCRTPGAQEGLNDCQNAERLSELSLRYPNITGAMCDDVTALFNRTVLPDGFAANYKALKKHNDKLRMYGTVYVHELPVKNFSYIQDYMDVVTLWFWYKDEILEYDEKIELCRQKFPGKPIIQGIFLHEYGWSDVGNVPELLCYQLDRTREYIAKGIVEGVIILGDREIKKWPETAEAVRNYLLNQ